MSKKFHHWNKRWFVFDRKRKMLSYYSDNTSRKARGIIYFQVSINRTDFTDQFSESIIRKICINCFYENIDYRVASHCSRSKRSTWITWTPYDRRNLPSLSSWRLRLDFTTSWHLVQKLCVFGSTLYLPERRDITNLITAFDDTCPRSEVSNFWSANGRARRLGQEWKRRVSSDFY